MKAIRLLGALAVTGGLAGCAGTNAIDPVASPVLTKAEPKVEIPEVAVKPKPPQRTVSAKPAPTPTPTPAPWLPEVTPRYEPQVVTVPVEPVVQTYEEAEPEPMPLVAAQPEPVEYKPIGDLDVAPAPVVSPPPAYEMVTVPDLPATQTTTRSMAPIRDDPQDGRDSRRAANNEVRQHARKGYRRNAALRAGGMKPAIRSNFTPAFGMKLEQAALGRLNPSVRYDARYVQIGYPWGDVDETTGVCTDVVIRSYRTLGIDLQELVHEDMKRAFHAYPSKRIYGLKKADPNIDHRRVVNLEAFFERTGAAVSIGKSPDDFKPGDVLTWRLSGNEPHIGVVVSDRDPRSGYPLVVHNLGAGVRKDDLITLSDPVGHFRFAPDRQTLVAQLVTKQ